MKGNTIFRQLIEQYSHDYSIAEKMDKIRVSKQILAQIRSMIPTMRLLKRREDGTYYEIDERKAVETVSHALRDKMEQGEMIQEPTENDILFGRGGQTNHHPGEKTVYIRPILYSPRGLVSTHSFLSRQQNVSKADCSA